MKVKAPMLFLAISVLCALAINSSTADNEGTPSDIVGVQKQVRNPPVEMTINKISGTKTELCREKPCVRKCCSIKSYGYMVDEFHNSGICKSKNTLGYSLGLPNPPIYTRELEKTEKIFNNTFQILKGYTVIRDGWLVTTNFYVIEDGTLMVERPNYYDRFIKYDDEHFCMDYVRLFGNETDNVMLRPFILPQNEIPAERDHTVSLISMLISSAFLIATLAVYIYVPRLHRRLHGKVLMAYASCLLGFFLTQSIYQMVYEIRGSIRILCHILGVPSYFLILASFFWMNIMSFDTWFQLRNTINSRFVKMKEKRRLMKYCAYGFGAPFAMSIIFAILNYLPMEKINTAVVTPGITNKGCFLGGMERLFYLYIPMAILIGANFVLFIATSIIICRLNKQSAGHKRKFMVYVKIFLVMGVSWVLEITSSIEPNLLIWRFTDAYNCLVGFFIFLIFVCNKRVFGMIAERYRRGAPSYTSPTTNINISDSNSSEEVEQELRRK